MGTIVTSAGGQNLYCGCGAKCIGKNGHARFLKRQIAGGTRSVDENDRIEEIERKNDAK